MNDIGTNHSVRPSILQQIASVMRVELREVVTDSGVALIMLFAIFIYATLYGLAYGSEVLRDVPIAVVDEGHTPSSRRLAAALGEGPNVEIAFEAQDMEQARRLLYEREIYGVVYIPTDYERSLLGGGQATVAVYCDASYFLIYRQALEQIVATLTATGAMTELRRLVAQGRELQQATAVSEPIIYESQTLFNPYLGYGTFVMPAIFIVIIQQTLLMGIGIVGGTWRERRPRDKDGTLVLQIRSKTALFIGKVATYFVVSGGVAALALTIPYYLLGYPMHGSVWVVTALVVPYILACVMLGILLSTLFRHREDPVLWLLWSSIPILMLSGVSYPRSAMPEVLVALGALLPSSHAIEAFIRVRDMGASLVEIVPSIVVLSVQTVVYGLCAALALRLPKKKV